MTWVRIDDEFEDNAKVAPLSDSAHRVWLMANCWCKKPKNFHTNGFVPEAMLPEITRNRYNKKQLRNLVDELVNANVGGTKEHGLWEPVDGGWQFHDWEQYLSKEDLREVEEGPKLSKREAGSLGGKSSVQSRRQSNGTAQPKRPPKQAPKQPPKQSECASELLTEASSNHSRSPDPDPVPKEERERGRAQASHEAKRHKPKDPFGDSFIPHGDDEKALFEAYRDESGKTGVRFDDTRAVWLDCARCGVTAEQVRVIVRGAMKEKYAVDRGLVPALILGTSGQRTKYLALDSAQPDKPKHSPPQPNDNTNRYQPREI